MEQDSFTGILAKYYIPEDSVVLWEGARYDGNLCIYLSPAHENALLFCVKSLDVVWGGYYELEGIDPDDEEITIALNVIDNLYPKYMLELSRNLVDAGDLSRQ